jgi:hypothetical protein
MAMRVLCIDATNPLEPEKLEIADWIYEGETYTVSAGFGMNKQLFYLLVEKPGVNYLAKRFIPVAGNVDEETAEIEHEEHLTTNSI